MRHLIPFAPVIFVLLASSASAVQIPEALNLAKNLISATIFGNSLANLTARHEDDVQLGVIRLTDDNWDDQVTKGSKEDVWVTVIHGPMGDRIAKQFNDAHTNATRESKDVEGIDHVKWARVDYQTEVELCTRWLVLKPPYFVFASNQGKELRFLGPSQFRPDGEQLLRLVKLGQWVNAPLWESEWAPGGNRAWLIEIYTSILSKWNKYTKDIPSFVFIIISGALAQQGIVWLHRTSPPKAAANPRQRPLTREPPRAAAGVQVAQGGEGKKDQ